MDLGFVGLAQSGKTALFKAVTAGHAHVAASGVAEPSIGTVKIPDQRLDRLCDLLRPRKVTHAEARYLDFPGSLSLRGDGSPGAYLAALSECDALVHVVHAFRNDAAPHPEGSVDPHRDIADVNLELTIADAALLQRRHKRLETEVRSARPGERDAAERELSLINRMREALERETPLRALEISQDERRLISGYQLLTAKPLLILVNIDEADIASSQQIESEFAERWADPGVEVAALCAKLEQELTELSSEDAAEFRQELGLKEGGLGRMLLLSQQVLGLITFFTVNEPEGRAWPLRHGSTALEAAGKVHTDMARGFIRSEAIGWQELVECGSMADARKKGLLRTEGRQYIVQDGDLLHILFNV